MVDATMTKHLIRAGRIALARQELDFALSSFAEGEEARGNHELIQAVSETMRALGHETVESFLAVAQKQLDRADQRKPAA